MTLQEAFRVLGISPDTLLKDARQKYKQLLMKHHPDKGGSTEITQSLTVAWDKVKEHLPETEQSKQEAPPDFDVINMGVRTWNVEEAWKMYQELFGGIHNQNFWHAHNTPGYDFERFWNLLNPEKSPYIHTLNMRHTDQESNTWKWLNNQYDRKDFIQIMVNEHLLNGEVYSNWHYFGVKFYGGTKRIHPNPTSRITHC